jgi:hypothetical protein
MNESLKVLWPDGHESAEVSRETLLSWFRQGAVSRDALVFESGQQRWLPLPVVLFHQPDLADKSLERGCAAPPASKREDSDPNDAEIPGGLQGNQGPPDQRADGNQNEGRGTSGDTWYRPTASYRVGGKDSEGGGHNEVVIEAKSRADAVDSAEFLGFAVEWVVKVSELGHEASVPPTHNPQPNPVEPSIPKEAHASPEDRGCVLLAPSSPAATNPPMQPAKGCTSPLVAAAIPAIPATPTWAYPVASLCGLLGVGLAVGSVALLASWALSPRALTRSGLLLLLPFWAANFVFGWLFGRAFPRTGWVWGLWLGLPLAVAAYATDALSPAPRPSGLPGLAALLGGISAAASLPFFATLGALQGCLNRRKTLRRRVFLNESNSP